MPTRLSRLERTYRRWVPPYWEFPTTAPTEEGKLVQSWTNDLLISENHGVRSRSELSEDSRINIGGPFLAHKRSYEEQILNSNGDAHFSWSQDPKVTASPYYLTNQWPWKDEFNNSHFPLPEASTDDQLGVLGATAIARTVPTKPLNDLGTFVAEAREGIPSVIGSSFTSRASALKARNAGDEYLNVEFGWKPLIRDVQNAMDTIRRSEELLDEYHSNSGKVTKRHYRFPTELKVEEQELGYKYPVPLLHPRCYSGGPQMLHMTTTTKVERWFSAAYTYYVPDPGTAWRKYSDYSHLYGARLTPETLWNAAPWSWAADWVANLGDVMTNMTALSTDGLVILYAYMMEHKTNVVEYWMDCHDMWYSHPGQHVLRQKFTAETKKRIGASPYGFGLTFEDFTPRQLGILGALGISKSHG